jgi:hypothetical protein
MEFNDQAPPAEFMPPEVEELQPIDEALVPQEPGQPAVPPGRTRLQQLHTFLVKEGTDAPEDYQVFEQKLLEKPERLKQLHTYLVDDKADVPVDYTIFEEKILEGLKKKVQSADSPSTAEAAGAPASTGGSGAGLTPIGNPLPLGDAEFVQTDVPLSLPGDLGPAAGQPTETALPGLETAAPTPDPVVQPDRPPTAEELAALDQLPGDARPVLAVDGFGHALLRNHDDLPTLPDGYTRVRLPDDYAGGVPEKTYTIPGATEPNARYYDRALSKEVAGEGEQSLGLAAARNFNNLVADGFKGLATGLDDATRLISNATGLERGGAFADVAQALETTKKPVADYYTQRQSVLTHPNAKNLLMATSDVAGMAVPLVAQALAPEAGAGRMLTQALGTGAGLMFDGQIIQGAHDRAIASGMNPDQTALYTLLDGGLSVLTFKAGGALLGKVAGKLTPEAVKSEILRETYRTLAARPAGQQLTRQELADVLAQATAAATPRILKVATEGGKLGTLFGVNEAKTILTEAAARATIGAKFTQPTLGEAVKRVVGATAEGAVIGGLTGAATPAPKRMLQLGRTSEGRPLAVELNEQGEPESYHDDKGPVDFGKEGPPPAVQAAVVKAKQANPAPLPAEQLLSDRKVPVFAHRDGRQLFADYDLGGKPTRLYAENSEVFALDDPQISALVESKWPGAPKETKGRDASTSPAPIKPTQLESVASSDATKGDESQPFISSDALANPVNLKANAESASIPAPAATADVPGGNTALVSAPKHYATPAENRAAGAFEKNGQVYTRQAPLGESVARGKQATAEFSSGVQQPVQYAVMEAADLQPSHLGGSQNLNHFLPEAQPKNRSAAYDPASQKAIADIAASPDLGRLGESPNAYSGAPVVNQRGEALQGNGRAAGVREHYRTGGESYRRDVVATAEKAGIPAEQTARFKEPVLVRVADVSDAKARELGNYTAADTESGGKRRLDVRQASGKLDERGRADLVRLATPQGDATLTEALRANGPELLRLLRRAGAANETQLQTMVKADGTLTLPGVEDLSTLYRHQLFVDGDPNLPELFTELPAAAQGGLDRAGGALLGLPESASLVPEVQQAISGVRELLANGTDFATWVGQADMFRGSEAPRDRYSPLTLRLIELLATEKRPTVIARYFQEYAAAVRGAADSLFGATPPKNRTEGSRQVFGVADDQPALNIRREDISNTEEPGSINSLTQPPLSDERPRPDSRDAGAAQSPAGQRATDQRPASPEPPTALGPDAAANNAAGAPADAGDSQPQPAGRPAGAPASQRGAVAGEATAPTLASVNAQLQQALASGDQTVAAEHFAQAEKLAQEQAARGPEGGRPSTAFRILAENAPAAMVHKAEQEVAGQRAKAEAKLEKQAVGEGKQVRQEKAVALDHALASPTVRATREKITGKTRPTTKEQLAAVRAERAGLVEELKNASNSTSGVAYSSVVPITPAQARAAELHLKIFRTYIREGVVQVRDLVARWKRDAGPLLAGMPDAELTKLATTALVDHRDAVRQGVADLGTTLDKIARDYTTDPAAVGATLAQRFVDGAGLSLAEAQQYADAIRQEFDKRIGAARKRRLDQFNQQAASGGAKPTRADLDRVRELFALAPTDDAAILDHLRRATVLPALTPDEAAHLRKLADEVTAAPTGFQKDAAVGELLHATAQLKAVDWLEVGNALWYANVMSGYKTHGVNLFANGLQTGAELLVHTAQALATGKGRYATASAKGLVQGLHRGAREAVSALATGREVSRDGVKFEEPGLLEYRRFAGGAANPVNYLKFVGRALRAGDVLFSTGLKEMRAHELAVKEALAEGTDGEPSAAVWARVNEKLYHTAQRLTDARAQASTEGLTGNDHARRVFEIAEQSRPVAMMEEAREYGTRAVFNGNVKGGLGWATEGIQHITQGIDIAGFKPAKYVVPFTRVIANVANAALDYTPVGAARAGISLSREQLGRGSGGHLFGGKLDSKMQRQLTGEERGHLAIKSAFGAAVAITAYNLTHNKDEQGNPTLEISGAGTGTPSEDAQLRADGWQPYSIKAGGRWYSYASTPVGIMLSVIGNLSDGEKYRGEHVENSEEALGAVALNSFRALQLAKDMTALKGAADFLAAADSKSPDQVIRWAQRLAVGTVKGYVPWSALLTQLAKDGQQLAGEPRKQARSLRQSLVQDIPVARNGLHDALDVLGDPLPIDTDRLISSAPYREAPTRAVWDWLEKNDLFITVPNRNSGGAMVLRAHKGEETPMTDDEYFTFMKKRGQLLKEALQHQLPELQKLDAKEAKKQLQKVVKRVTSTAKQQVFGNSPATAK